MSAAPLHLRNRPARPLPETRRVARLLDLACCLGDAPGRWTRAALARRYEVSERQITKDLDLLRHTLRTEITKVSPAGGYRFTRAPELRWLRR